MAQAIAIVGMLASGAMQKKAADKEADALEDEAALIQDDADRSADIQAVENRKFLATQSLAYLKNGVTLEGSPLMVLQDSWEIGQKEEMYTRESGKRKSYLAHKKSQSTRRSGRAALVGGVAGAASQYSKGTKGKAV
jgi:hypothetical protein